MQAVILAGGRGKRFGEITKEIPKPLLLVNNKPIILHILDRLPATIDQILVVVGYHGNKIQEELRGHSDICFVEQIITGTGGALWSTKSQLNDRFLVINGDDIYGIGELEKILNEDAAFGLCKRKILPGEKFMDIKLDKSNCIRAFIPPADGADIINVATGAYFLDKRIFNYELAKLSTGEYGLPQTILQMRKDISIKGVFIQQWYPINTPDDLQQAELALQK